MSDAAPTPPAKKKPRAAMVLATGFGLGCIPKAPGTAGSLLGVALTWWVCQMVPPAVVFHSPAATAKIFLQYQVLAAVVVAGAGVWAAHRAARFAQKKDPQVIVIDEVSGQMIPFLFFPPTIRTLYIGIDTLDPNFFIWPVPVNWKYLLMGFILFRVFDIWKPFPARAAERLPGGWGIMADDWVAGVYAALGLWIARGLGF